uniref:glutathione transferase n=1 Tax=Neogobius melanostomus TaxID=47308 RepID=A0A8C6WJM9_9GOBI
MSLKLFLDMISQPCRSVFLFAKKNNLPVEVKLISLKNGEQHTEKFRKVNPLRKVPALKDGDFCMGESIPMMEYMAEKFNTPDHWFPKDLQKRARVNEYLSWQHLGIRRVCFKLLSLREEVDGPVVKLEVPEDKMARAMEDLNWSLDLIEKTFIKDGGFIGGEQISIADLVAIVEIMQPFASGVDVFQGRAKLSAWKERVVQAVGKELFDEAHKTILSAKDSVKQLDSSKVEYFRPRVLRLIS